MRCFYNATVTFYCKNVVFACFLFGRMGSLSGEWMFRMVEYTFCSVRCLVFGENCHFTR